MFTEFDVVLIKVESKVEKFKIIEGYDFFGAEKVYVLKIKLHILKDKLFLYMK